MRGAGCSRVKSRSENEDSNSHSIMNRIMLRFRPIAPKPSGGEDSSSADLDKRNATVKNGKRTKRKYVRVRGRQRKSGRSEKSSGVEDGDFSSEEKGGGERVVTTLQLLPDRSESEKSYCYAYNNNNSGSQADPHKYLDDDDDQLTYKVDAHHDHTGVIIRTWITVECITEIYTDAGLGFGVSDRERINNLEMDTCPGFISDGSNNVVWVNEAYRKLVQQGDDQENITNINGGGGGGVMACLVVKHKLPYLAPSFACRVRMIQQTRHGHNWNRIVPCDVWRMDFPGFAWKLDVNTALGLAI